MSGNDERISERIICPICRKHNDYFTLTYYHRGVAFVYPEEPHRTRFAARVAIQDNPWDSIESVNGVFCPICTNHFEGNLVVILKHLLYRQLGKKYERE